MTYFKQLIDTNSTVSSKIAIGLVFTIVTILLVAAKIFMSTIPMELLYFVGGMTLSFFGLSSIEKFSYNKYINKNSENKVQT